MRKFFKFVFIGFNILMVVWLIGGLASVGGADDSCTQEAANNPFLTIEDCESATAVGASIGVGILLFIWALGDVILGLPLLLIKSTKADKIPLAQATRECRHCKSHIRRDATVCAHCQRESDSWIFHGNAWWVKRESGDYWLNEKSGHWVRYEPQTT